MAPGPRVAMFSILGLFLLASCQSISEFVCNTNSSMANQLRWLAIQLRQTLRLVPPEHNRHCRRAAAKSRKRHRIRIAVGSQQGQCLCQRKAPVRQEVARKNTGSRRSEHGSSATDTAPSDGADQGSKCTSKPAARKPQSPCCPSSLRVPIFPKAPRRLVPRYANLTPRLPRPLDRGRQSALRRRTPGGGAHVHDEPAHNRAIAECTRYRRLQFRPIASDLGPMSWLLQDLRAVRWSIRDCKSTTIARKQAEMCRKGPSNNQSTPISEIEEAEKLQASNWRKQQRRRMWQ